MSLEGGRKDLHFGGLATARESDLPARFGTLYKSAPAQFPGCLSLGYCSTRSTSANPKQRLGDCPSHGAGAPHNQRLARPRLAE